MILKRRREKKTDYKQRLALLKSGKIRAVVRRSLNNTHIQFVDYAKTGDKVLAEVMSKHLKKYGWKFHGGCIPAAYLTGLLAGLKARKSNINEAILDAGVQTSVKGNAVYAAVFGIKQSGVSIPLGSTPDYGRISGKHIAEYARKLKAEDKKEYAKRFSGCIKNDADPEKLPENFEEVKKKIAAEFGATLEEPAEEDAKDE